MILRTKYNRRWECLEIDELDEGKSLGHCRYELRQIVISNKAKNKFSVLVHELLHAASYDYGIGLTERQVELLEIAIIRFLKLNKIFQIWSKLRD